MKSCKLVLHDGQLQKQILTDNFMILKYHEVIQTRTCYIKAQLPDNFIWHSDKASQTPLRAQIFYKRINSDQER